jgi:hypothetical protein
MISKSVGYVLFSRWPMDAPQLPLRGEYGDAMRSLRITIIRASG